MDRVCNCEGPHLATCPVLIEDLELDHSEASTARPAEVTNPSYSRCVHGWMGPWNSRPCGCKD